MGSKNNSSILQFLNFGVLFLILLQFNILTFTSATEIDLLKKQKPLQKIVSVYSDAARFHVDIPDPTGGPFLKCAEHVVQVALQSNPSAYSFSKSVTQKSDGFIVGNLNSNTDYFIRVACKFAGASQPGEWSEPLHIHTTMWTSKIPDDGKRGTDDTNQQQHHHHHHHDGDHQHDEPASTTDLEAKELIKPTLPRLLPIPSMLRQDFQDTSTNFSELIPTSKNNNDSLSLRIKVVNVNSENSSSIDDKNNNIKTNEILQKHWGVLGEWAKLECISSLAGPNINFEWIHVNPDSNENITVQPRFGVHIVNEGNISVLELIVKTEDMFGDYICETSSTIDVDSSEQKESQKLILIKGRRPPKIHLIPEWILMTSASFKVEKIVETHDDSLLQNNHNNAEGGDELVSINYGEELPIIEYVVWIKPSCHILGPWIRADVSEQEDGFRINNLHPNEGYYVKAALRNTGAIGDYGEYWKIRTSSAILLKSSIGVRTPVNYDLSTVLILIFFIIVY